MMRGPERAAGEKYVKIYNRAIRACFLCRTDYIKNEPTNDIPESYQIGSEERPAEGFAIFFGQRKGRPQGHSFES